MADEKSVTREITIAADAETVWRALTEGEELKRWFTLDARVRPGEGGAIWMSFGEGMEWETPITVWEPNRRLQTADPAPNKIAVDYYIESKGGETVVRLVHSGFGADSWDEELDTLGSGWMTFLANLRHYLERHRGEPRTVAHFRHPVVPLERRDAFPRVMNALGFSTLPEVGERYAVTTRGNDRLEGTVLVSAAPINLTATVENLGDAFLMVEMEPGRGKCRPAMWLSLYGDAQGEAPAAEERLKALLTGAFSDVV